MGEEGLNTRKKEDSERNYEEVGWAVRRKRSDHWSHVRAN